MADLLEFEEVYRRHSADVLRFCIFQLRDLSTAEDVAADVFVSAFLAYERTRPAEDGVRVWLIRIARNAVIDYQRRNQKWRRVMSALIRDRDSRIGDVEALAGSNETIRELTSAMAGLRKRERLLISLRYGADLSFDQVGAVLGMSPKAASTATSRAVERLCELSGDLLNG